MILDHWRHSGRFSTVRQVLTYASIRMGVLLVNLGTPDEPTTAAVRRYLAEFLSDPRVVELPRLIWWAVLHGYILRTRPARSAAAYRKIWSEQGSPLLLHTRDIAAGIQEKLSARLSGAVHVEVGMSYGQPSIDAALEKNAGRQTRGFAPCTGNSIGSFVPACSRRSQSQVTS